MLCCAGCCAVVPPIPANMSGCPPDVGAKPFCGPAVPPKPPGAVPPNPAGAADGVEPSPAKTSPPPMVAGGAGCVAPIAENTPALPLPLGCGAAYEGKPPLPVPAAMPMPLPGPTVLPPIPMPPPMPMLPIPVMPIDVAIPVAAEALGPPPMLAPKPPADMPPVPPIVPVMLRVPAGVAGGAATPPNIAPEVGVGLGAAGGVAAPENIPPPTLPLAGRVVAVDPMPANMSAPPLPLAGRDTEVAPVNMDCPPTLGVVATPKLPPELGTAATPENIPPAALPLAGRVVAVDPMPANMSAPPLPLGGRDADVVPALPIPANIDCPAASGADAVANPELPPELGVGAVMLENMSLPPGANVLELDWAVGVDVLGANMSTPPLVLGGLAASPVPADADPNVPEGNADGATEMLCDRVVDADAVDKLPNMLASWDDGAAEARLELSGAGDALPKPPTPNPDPCDAPGESDPTPPLANASPENPPHCGSIVRVSRYGSNVVLSSSCFSLGLSNCDTSADFASRNLLSISLFSASLCRRVIASD